MQCEVCGKEILGKPRKVIIEGARMVVCSKCASLGSPYIEPKSVKHTLLKKGHVTTLHNRRFKGYTIKRSHKSIYYELEVKEGFGRIVKKAREKMNLTHEDLGKMISEKASVIKKVEGEKITPDNKLARKLEHALKIKLLVPSQDEAPPKKLELITSPLQPTLEDVVHLKVRRAEKRRR